VYSIFLKEINSFFSSLVGVLALSVFLLIMGLFLWLFPDTSILSYEYAGLDQFSQIAPFILLFLIPAITMRSFSEEIHSGTLELLSTRPLTEWQIVLGKYFASLFLIVLALLPTLVYYYSVYQLGSPAGNIDMGATNGSYIGLFLLAASFSAIGLFTSSVTSNQIVAFITAVFICFVFYQAFEYLSKLSVFYASFDRIIELIGIEEHYISISRGVVDSRDILYFFSLIFFFLYLTYSALISRKC